MTIDSHNLHQFHGGLYLPGHKEPSLQRPLARVPLPPRLYLPLQQHIGTPAEPCVEVGDAVLKGQVLAFAEGYVSVPLHAPTSGRIVEIDDHPVPHPSGLSAPCVVLEPDGEDRWLERPPGNQDYRALNPSALRNRIREAGIVGLGGAGFPSFIKLNPGTRRKVELLVLNGAECEPYITCDDMLMRSRPDEVIRGAEIMRHALSAEHCVVAIEDDKPEAIAALRRALKQRPNDAIEVVQVPTRYPSGGEKQLIRVLTGREVPSHGLPLDIGIVCHNVATAAAVFRALTRTEPLVERIVTVTGAGVHEPRNVEVAIGTPFRHVVEFCGGYTEDAHALIMGGPMMGFTLDSDEVPVIKTTNCILVAGRREVAPSRPALPCIRCGACVDVCPANLLPQQLYWYSRSRDFDKTQDYHLFDCIECGCCAHVCPSHIPLVQYFRFAKTEIWSQEREKRKADHARRRHEFHLERLEREKREREERMRKKKEALKRTSGEGAAADPKKAAIEAALARVRAKQAERGRQGAGVDRTAGDRRRESTEGDAALRATVDDSASEHEVDKTDQ